ncbi:MAG TPA: two-component regulator propeller domain-containing protein [Candidatus Sulfotelmatobacter sp.]
MISWRKQHRWILRGIALICFARHMYGLDPNRPLFQYVRESWNTEAKFPGGAVNAIAQTPDGYLWIGTEKGLFRFDGFSFVRVSLPSIADPSSAPILSLLTDASGALWVRVQGADVLRQRNGKFQAVAYGTGPLSSHVTALSKDRNGAILVSDVIKGTFRFVAGDPQKVATPEALPGSSPVISMAETSEGKIWLGTLGVGLFLLADDHAAEVNATFPERKINCLLPIGKDDLLVGTDHGLYRWSDKDYRRDALPASLGNLQILSLLRDRDSTVWVGTDRGLLRINEKGTSFSDGEELRGSGAINVLFEDREGNIWVGGAGGLDRIRDSVFMTFSSTGDSRLENIGPIYVDAGGRYWFAPGQGGLYAIKEAHLQPGSSAVPANDVVYSIGGRREEIWVGRQRGGLTHLQWANGTVSSRTFTVADGLAQNSVYSVFESRDGSVWAGTLSGGVSRFRDGRFTTYTAASGLASNTVSSILETQDGAMWFATPNGLSSFSDNQWKSYRIRDGLPSANVNCLFEDSAGVLWSGTSAGLAALVSRKVQVPSLPDALREPIFGIAEDKAGRFWITTSGHVLQVPRDKLLAGNIGAGDIREFGPADGLPSSEGVNRSRSVITDSEGRIWISVKGGLSVVDPSHLASSWSPAIAHIESVRADGIAITPIDSIRVPADHKRITFAYTALSLAVPERIRFRYFLENFDRQWSEPSTAREAVYTNLGPGTYRFRVLASNSYGEWNGSESVIRFEVEPASWQTWWFRLTSAALLASVVLVFYRLHLHRLTQQLNMRFEERLAERTRIAQELHDTLLQGFLSASMQLHVADDQLPTDSPAKPLITRVLALMGRVIDEGRNAVRGLRSDPGDAHDLGQAFSRVAQEFVMQGVDFRVVMEGLPRALHPVIRDEVYRIGRESLVNAIRHSGASKIEVEVDYSASNLRVLVRDNGCGIDPQVLRAGRDGHWGLPGMRERAENVGAKLRLWSRVTAGTEVELTVPGRIAFQSHVPARPRQWFARVNPRPVAHEAEKPESKQQQ